MPYSCQTCARRKVKCDKVTPICSRCQKSQLNCVYQAPPPRQRRRPCSSENHNNNEKLARYERILHQHGLLPQAADATTSPEEASSAGESISLDWNEPVISGMGQFLAGQGKSRYLESALWRSLGDDELHGMSHDEEEDQSISEIAGDFSSDPLTGAFLGLQGNLLHFHPAPAEAMVLWQAHVENVEPICKILHIPSVSKMVETISQQPAMASKADECLLFAIYQFAIFSLTENECARRLGQSRNALLQRFHVAARQALVNASFLKTTDMSVVQALVLFLLPCRYLYDPHTYWILTGVANRIGQRIGLHRDGEKLGLPPFEVQMRRRLCYQIIPLEGIASQVSGAQMPLIPESWDTKPPLNLNDDQIWPGMTEPVQEQKGATEMMFCLARACLGKFFLKTMRGAYSGLLKNYDEVEAEIDQAESEVEEKYVRYCDIVDPLHYLTISFVRSAITAMRLRSRLSKLQNKAVTNGERKELFQLAQKILDTDAAAYTHAGLRKFLWHGRPFFVWGSWDSLIYFLTTLRKADLLSPVESDAAWRTMQQVYENHGELLQAKPALHFAIGRLTLKAWDDHPPSRGRAEEPAFITILRSLQKAHLKPPAALRDQKEAGLDARMEAMSPFGSSAGNDADALGGPAAGEMDLDLGNDFNLDTVDWTFWDRMIQDYQMQGGEQPAGFSQ